MRIRQCHSCHIMFEAVGRFSDRCPACGLTVKGNARYINDSEASALDVKRTTFNDDDLDQELYG